MAVDERIRQAEREGDEVRLAHERRRAGGDLRCPACEGWAHRARDGDESWTECTAGCGWTSSPDTVREAIQPYWRDSHQEALDALERVADTADEVEGYACYEDGQDRWCCPWADYLESVDLLARDVIQWDPEDAAPMLHETYQRLCDTTPASWSLIGAREEDTPADLPREVQEWLYPLGLDISISIDAQALEDHDDRLAAAAALVQDRPGLEGWDLQARWEDEDRDRILLTLPTWGVVAGDEVE